MMPSKIFLLLITTVFFFTTEAQKVKTTKKAKAKEEEIEKPPPPQEELREVRIDTSGTIEAPSAKGFSKEDFFFNMPDTSTAPNDELTSRLKDLLDISGALDIGVQFAKLMNSNNEQERNGLPKEFYQKMYEAMTTGDTRKMFENELIKIYRKYYTLEDVNAVLAFYNTDAGKKTLKNLPSIMDESKKVGEGFGKVIAMKIYNDLLKEGKIK